MWFNKFELEEVLAFNEDWIKEQMADGKICCATAIQEDTEEIIKKRKKTKKIRDRAKSRQAFVKDNKGAITAVSFLFNPIGAALDSTHDDDPMAKYDIPLDYLNHLDANATKPFISSNLIDNNTTK